MDRYEGKFGESLISKFSYLENNELVWWRWCNYIRNYLYIYYCYCYGLKYYFFNWVYVSILYKSIYWIGFFLKYGCLVD